MIDLPNHALFAIRSPEEGEKFREACGRKTEQRKVVGERSRDNMRVD